MTQLFFLSADSALTKTFNKKSDGSLDKFSYPVVRDFTSHVEEVSNLTEFHDAVVRHAALGHCLLKGQLTKLLDHESRAGSTNPHTATDWICFDIDGLPLDSIEAFVSTILPVEFHGVGYVLQHSASYGIDSMSLRAHLFYLLDKPVRPEDVKLWVSALNLLNPVLNVHTALTAAGVTLRFPLDRTVNQNDKLIYIAPPTLSGMEDPLAGRRIALVAGASDRVAVAFTHDAPAKIDQLTRDRVAELRRAAGLRARQPRIDYVDDMEVVENPDKARVTSTRAARGFVYLNLNGGDSFAYWHPAGNPQFIRNFKGEPYYRTKDIDAAYYASVIREVVNEKGLRPLAFRYIDSDTYYNLLYDPATDTITDGPHQVSTKARIEDFFSFNGACAPDAVEDWDLRFNPTTNVQIDATQRFVNRFRPTRYMLEPGASNRVPPVIDKVLWSILGDDVQCYHHFLNWLAFIFQTRTKTGTAWICHGTQGTGKGVFYNYILRPLFGEAHAVQKLLRELDDKFNDYMEHNLIFVLDEVKLSAERNASQKLNQIKSMITEPTIPVRGMRKNPTQVNSYSNFLFYSNDYDAFELDLADRRFNVAPRQEKPLRLVGADIDAITESLGDFAGFLAAYEVSEIKARTVLANDAKAKLRDASQDSLERTCQAVLDGNLSHFMAYLDAKHQADRDFMEYNRFRSVLAEWVEDANIASYITLDQLTSVMAYTVLTKHVRPAQLIKMLATANLTFVSRGTYHARDVTWKAPADQVAAWEALLKPRTEGSVTQLKRTA